MSDNQSWIQIKATGKREYLDDITAVMSMIDNSLMIEDFSDVEKDLDGVYGDLIDEELLKADKTVVSVSVFVAPERSPIEAEHYAASRFEALNLDVKVETIGVSEEDWADSWKQYYKPIKTGKRIVIVPVWEKYDAKPEELIVLMDPGMAFGTGTHETTRLCASMLEKYITEGESMLDVGCGSGILAICASKLGAKECFACDIDPVAVRIANENAEINKTPNVKAEVSDLLKQVLVKENGYDIICANIVADVIIRMAPDIGKFMNKESILIVSGIIVERAEETIKALNQYGLEVVDSVRENGWYCGVVKKK